MFKIGDAVTFINEKQQGTVVGILDNRQIEVEIEDGFSIVVYEKEIIKIKTIKVASEQKIEIEDDKSYILDQIQEFSGIILYIIPIQGQISKGDINIYIINKTKHQLFYTIYCCKSNSKIGFGSGQCESGSINKIKSISTASIIDKNNFQFEGLLYNEGIVDNSTIIKKQFELELPTTHQTFPKSNSPYCFARTINIYDINNESKFSVESIDALNEHFNNKDKRSATSVKTNSKGNTIQAKQIIIDLHIEEITDDLSRINFNQILPLQIATFKKKLDEAIINKYKEMIIIHGVGSGVLKNKIREILIESNIYFEDGKMSDYGYGATKAIIYR